MPEFIAQFTDAEIKVRHKEPYLTAGLNEKLAGIVPKGIHRGFRLAAGGVIFQVNVVADEDTSDHVAQYETGTGYALRIRKTGGDFALDLSTLADAVVNKVYVLAIYSQYIINSTTTSIIRAYELSPVDEFTGAAERDELVVLGEATIPLTGAPAPVTVVGEAYRSSPWEMIGVGTREPSQIIQNGDFALCSDDVPTAGEILWPCWDYPGATETGCTWTVVNFGVPAVGRHHLRLSTTGVAGQVAILPYEGLYRVRPGARIKSVFWLRRTGAITPGASGHIGLRIRAYSGDLTSVVATYYVEDLTPSLTYEEEELAVKLPSSAHWISLDVYFDDDNGLSSGEAYFDDIRLWVEQPHITDGEVQGWLPLHYPALTARSLDIAPSPATYASIEGFLDYVLTLRHGAGSEYVMQRRRDLGDFVLHLLNGGLRVGNLIDDLGSSRIGDEIEAAQPRVMTPIPNETVAHYVLLWKADFTLDDGLHIRIYVTNYGMGGHKALVFTVNAEFYWDGGLGDERWRRDAAGSSTRLDVEQNGVFYYDRLSTAATPWTDTDWDNLTDSWPLVGFDRQRAAHTLLKIFGEMQLLLSGTPTESDLETGRIIVDVGNTVLSSRTAILDLKSMVDSAYCHTRLYSVITGADNRLEFVTNGKWNETDSDYDKDDSGEPGSRLLLTESGDFLVQRAPTATNPFTEGDWATLFIVDAQGDAEAHLEALDGRLEFVAATAGNSNLSNPGIDNALFASNIPKAWATFTAGLGSVTITEEFGVASIVVNGADSKILDITLDRHIDSMVMCAVGRMHFPGGVPLFTTTGTNTLEMTAYTTGPTQVDFAAASTAYTLILFGRQVP